MNRWALFMVLFLMASCNNQQTILPLKTLRRSIFKIQVVSQEPRFGQPWLYGPSRRSSGSGFFIGEGRIVTNAHVVAHGKFISVQRDGDAQATPAMVEFIAHDCDLAILKVSDEGALEGSRPLRLGALPKLQDKVATVGYPRGGEQISVTEGVVSRISYRRYSHPGYDRHLLVQVDSAINPGNSGGPVFQGDRVVGVAFQAQTNAENTGYIIPTPVVRRFLEDVKDGRYDGHPEDDLADISGAMENEGTRAYHGLGVPGGLKIAFVAPYSPLAKLILPGDVLLKVDNYEIGVDGKILYSGERIDFRIVYDLAQFGDSLMFSLLRNGQQISVKVPVASVSDHYNPSNIHTLRPRYLVHGGLVFSALSRDYLKAWGDRWYYDAPVSLRYLHRYFYLEPAFQQLRDIIVLADVLPDQSNIDANAFKEQVLESLGGRSLNSLEDLRDRLAESKDEILKFGFWREGLPLYLSRQQLEARHDLINQRYKVQPDHWLGDRSQDGAVAGSSL